MNWDKYIDDLFLGQPIIGVTINWVYNSPTFRFTMFIILALTFAGAMIYFASRHHTFLQAIRSAFVVSFFTGGLLYALHADHAWSRWVIADYQAYAGHATEEKLRIMDGRLYDFIQLARRVIPGDYALSIDDVGNYPNGRFQYFMLPQRENADAPYLVVIADKDSRLDPASRTYTRENVDIKNVEPVLLFAKDAYILRKPQIDRK